MSTSAARDFSSRPRPPRGARLEWAALVLGAATLAVAVYEAGDAWRDEQRVRASLEETRAAADGARARIQQLESHRGPEHALAGQALLTIDAPPPRVVAELSYLLPADVRLEGLSLEYGGRLEVEMRVAARHRGAYDSFLDRLEASPLFGDVLPGEENREGEVRAVVRAVYRGAGA